MGLRTPWLYWEDRGPDYVYGLDWTVGAVVTVFAAAALVGSVFWPRRPPAPERSKGAGVVVALTSIVVLAAALALAFDLAWSRFFEGMFGRRSSHVVERFWPMRIQVWTSIVAGLSVAGVGVRAARRGLGWSAAKWHLCWACAAGVALGYGLWMRPSASMAVLGIEHPRPRLLKDELAWIHDSTTYVPEVKASLSGWRVVELQSQRVKGALRVEARAVRGPLSSTKQFSIPVVAERGHPRLPLAMGRRFRFEEVELAPTDDDALVVVPWDGWESPRELVIEVVAERWIEGRHFLDVRSTEDGTSQQLEVYGTDGVWWASPPGRLRLRESLVKYWLGQCAAPTSRSDGAGIEPLLCRCTYRSAWRLQPSG